MWSSESVGMYLAVARGQFMQAVPEIDTHDDSCSEGTTMGQNKFLCVFSGIKIERKQNTSTLVYFNKVFKK